MPQTPNFRNRYLHLRGPETTQKCQILNGHDPNINSSHSVWFWKKLQFLGNISPFCTLWGGGMAQNHFSDRTLFFYLQFKNTSNLILLGFKMSSERFLFKNFKTGLTFPHMWFFNFQNLVQSCQHIDGTPCILYIFCSLESALRSVFHLDMPTYTFCLSSFYFCTLSNPDSHH